MIEKNSHVCKFTKRKEKKILLSMGEKHARDVLIVYQCETPGCKKEMASDIKERLV